MDCFIIMPISTPMQWANKHYLGDNDHFYHIIEHLFVPAIKAAGFNPIRPNTVGADIIQATIIKQLAVADLVLCDMSTLNPNVFYEHGIRTALNKPVALVADDKTDNLPFDTAVINFHKYKGDALQAFHLKGEMEALTQHIIKSADSSNKVNTLWKYFGITSPAGDFKPEDASVEDSIKLLTTEVAALRNEFREYKRPEQATKLNITHPISEHTRTRCFCSICGLEAPFGSTFCDICGTEDMTDIKPST
jgi:nucleoside 2-deoxyribosyltransferase